MKAGAANGSDMPGAPKKKLDIVCSSRAGRFAGPWCTVVREVFQTGQR